MNPMQEVDVTASFFNAGYEAAKAETTNEIRFIKSVLRELRQQWTRMNLELAASDLQLESAKYSHMALAVSTALIEIERYERRGEQ